jgi:hypothetical protein
MPLRQPTTIHRGKEYIMSLDIHAVHTAIEKRIAWLEKVTKELGQAGDDKAKALADYDLAFAKAQAKLALGTVKQVGGEPLEGKPPATLIPKYAAGMCATERGELEIATNKYKSVVTKINVLSATLNAYQSLFRHLQ